MPITIRSNLILEIIIFSHNKESIIVSFHFKIRFLIYEKMQISINILIIFLFF